MNAMYPSPNRQYRLRFKVRDREQTHMLSPGEHRIGSADVNDVILPVSGVSRRHAQLAHHAEPSGGVRFWLRDLQSRNGTFVNDQRTTARELQPGDVLRCGPVELRLEIIETGDAELAMVLGAAGTGESLSRASWAALPLDETTTFMTGSDAETFPALHFPEGCVPGRSPAMKRLYRAVEALLGADLPVLIEGETGVGKESVAQTLHLSSRRCAGPFVAVNCAAIPGELLEAEMFGIGEGVATGVKKRPGKFRTAEGGTLFLDEIAEMPLGLQAKLLRALQEKEIQPVGGRSVPVDAWVLTATNLDLLQRVEEGHFRRDLYYRVAGCVLEVPPLRERRDDIPFLVEHFLTRTADLFDKSIAGVTVRALDALMRYAWPGNVRELEHEIRGLAHLVADGRAIESTLISKKVLGDAAAPDDLREPGAPKEGTLPASEAVATAVEEEESLRLDDHVRQTERRVILQALERARGSQRQAARILGISRTTLTRKIEKLGISF